MIDIDDARALNDLFEIIDRDGLDDLSRDQNDAGLPPRDRRIEINLLNYGPILDSLDQKRAVATTALKALAKAGLANGFTVTKRAWDNYFDLTLERGNISVVITTPANLTCTYEPVLDENGEPVVEEVEKLVSEKRVFQVPKTVRKCTPMLSAREFEEVGR
ncbi:MAG: hypothetical protein ACRCW4_11430 [Candidatus Neomicrothrix subdominans]